MAGRLAGKVALISGGARGQGETEARLFVKEGAQVVLGDVLVDLGQKVAADIVKQGGRATFVKLDVTQEADWQRAVDTTVRTYGKLNILVNNAGIFHTEGVEATSMELWNRVIAVNQTGVWLGMKFSVSAMRKAGGGSIVNISSGAGIIGTGMAAAEEWSHRKKPLDPGNNARPSLAAREPLIFRGSLHTDGRVPRYFTPSRKSFTALTMASSWLAKK